MSLGKENGALNLISVLLKKRKRTDFWGETDTVSLIKAFKLKNKLVTKQYENMF
jgi:hypothetical protein